jgi:cytoskeletal protein CcmA (bactofilin family)
MSDLCSYQGREYAMFDKRKDKISEHVHVNEPALTQPVVATAPTIKTAGKTAVIGPGIVINGDISGTESLLIEGKVKGHIQLASHDVTVGHSGEVHADVTAKIIRVAGKVEGDLVGQEKVIISSTGNVRGNIVAPRMLLEDGAIFKGSIDMDPGETRAAQVVSPAARVTVKSGNIPELATDAIKKNPDLALKSG